jgi:predicted enzyme related to lactoylglutathione lyase
VEIHHPILKENAMQNPVDWFEIYVQDMERARAFYSQVFQVQLERLDTPDLEMWSFPMDGERYGASGALVRMEGFQPAGNGVMVYFKCEDCAAEAGRAADHGGSVVKPKFSIGKYGHIALVKDTEGNMVGLHSMN